MFFLVVSLIVLAGVFFGRFKWLCKVSFTVKYALRKTHFTQT